jgi:hypothetical protein
LFFTLIPVLALLSNYDQENCLINVGTEGPGQIKRVEASEQRLALEYTGVNGSGQMKVAWRFDQRAIWIDAVEYDSTEWQDVVSLHYFPPCQH